MKAEARADKPAGKQVGKQAAEPVGKAAVEPGNQAAEPVGKAAAEPGKQAVEPGKPAGEGETGPAPAAAEIRPGWDKTLRVAGLAIAVLAAVLSAFFEVLLTTLRWGDLTSIWQNDPIGSGNGPLLGVSIVLAVVGNVAIAWFAVSTTGRRWALGPPWALWTLFMLIAAGFHTSEGDYLLGGNNMIALATILLGSVAFAVYTYRLILQPIRRP